MVILVMGDLALVGQYYHYRPISYQNQINLDLFIYIFVIKPGGVFLELFLNYLFIYRVLGTLHQSPLALEVGDMI